MRLRSLEITNVRRFAGRTARLGPFGDGLTTITAENEAGKSTFFDALHALFFVAHGSAAQEIKSLQPYSGGPVTIAAEIDLDGHGYRIEKTYLAQKTAQVTEIATGRIVGQKGEAEAWIDAQVNSTRQGPAGLLWVRQGASEVDAGGKDGQRGLEVRRDLMSSVRGQIDAVTGGRRMDRIVARCGEDLETLATKTLKPKAGGPWKQVEDEIDTLASELERLERDVQALAQALEMKRQARARLRDLQDPERQAGRAAQIDRAGEALKAAEEHDRSVQDARKAVQLIGAELGGLDGRVAQIADVQARRAELAERIAAQRTQAAEAAERRVAADRAAEQAAAALAAEEAKRRSLADAWKSARAAEKAAASWDRLRRLAVLREDLRAPMQQLAEAETLLAGPEVTQGEVDHLTDLSRRIRVAAELRRAQVARVSVAPSGTASVRLDGEALPPGREVLIDRALDLEIEGFGTVALRPAEATGLRGEDPEVLRGAFAAALSDLGFEDLAAAEQALAAREKAKADRRVATAQIRGLAPDGAARIAQDWHRLCAELGHPPDAAPPPPAETGVTASADEIAADMAGLDEDLQQSRTRLADLQQAASAAATDQSMSEGLLGHLSEDLGALAPPEGEAEALAALERARSEARARRAEATAHLTALEDAAPNLEAARAEHERLQSAARADEVEIQRFERELARADGAIQTQSEGAVEEKRGEVAGRLAKARERSGRYAVQARALALLIEHLEAARRDAQDTYFEPIRAELMPLLAQLHPGAEIELDPDRMLVGKIVRNGVEDAVGVLSGGASEQIAILTRLAFARLFARQGQHVPVILDDALVHTDDARISTMFNVLSQLARDQQIIVLSCRTRAFSDLGGARAYIVTETG